MRGCEVEQKVPVKGQGSGCSCRAWPSCEQRPRLPILGSCFGLEKRVFFFPPPPLLKKICFIEFAKQAQDSHQTPAFKTVLLRISQTDEEGIHRVLGFFFFFLVSSRRIVEVFPLAFHKIITAFSTPPDFNCLFFFNKDSNFLTTKMTKQPEKLVLS